MDLIWLFLTSAIIFMMQPGFALVELGLVTHRYVVNGMLKNLVDIAVAIVFFGTVGFTILFSDGDALFGKLVSFDPSDFSHFVDVALPLDGIRVFHITFAGAAAAIISGAVAGRIRMPAYIVISVFMCSFVYPMAGRAIWGVGWFHRLGIMDFAGGLVVHGVGGAAALACALALGPRIERLSPSGKLREMTGYNIALTGLGVFILWFAWFGFNCGSVLEFSKNQDKVIPIFLNTWAAAGVGMFTGIAYSYARFRFIKPVAAIESLMAGLVSITAGCAYVDLGATAVIAAVGALLVHATSDLVRWLRIDDPVNAFAVHAIPGLWGATAISLFASEAVIPNRLASFGVQLGGGAAIILFAFAAVYACCKVVAATIGLRVDKESEIRGIDRAHHDYETRFTSEDESHEARLRDQGRAVASMSHEILGSLNAAKIQTELLEMKLAGGENSAEPPDAEALGFLRERCSRTLVGLRRAEQIARLTLSYSGRNAKVSPSIGLTAAMRAAVDMIAVTHVESRVKVSVNVESEIDVVANEARLVQAFYNILRNACEAFKADVKGERLIAMELKGAIGEYVLTIRDNAGGMSPKVLDRVGDAFVTGRAGEGGLGLGLHLAREYLESLGFDLDIDSRRGVGTTFHIRIPLNATRARSSEDRHAHPHR